MGVLLSQLRSKLPTIPRPKGLRIPQPHEPHTNFYRAQEELPTCTAPTQATKLQRKPHVTIVGDSMIRNVCVKMDNTEVRKFTLSGARIEDVESRLTGIIGNSSPTTLIVHVGTNNLTGDNVDMLRQKYCNLIRKAKEACPEAEVVLSGMFKRYDVGYLTTSVEKGNDTLQELCRAYTVKYIDNMLLPNKREYVLKGDGLHLTRTGAGILTEKYSKIVGPFPDPLKGSAEKQECQDPVLVRPRRNPSVATPVTQRQQNSGYQTLRADPPYPIYIMPRHLLRGGRQQSTRDPMTRLLQKTTL